MPDVKRAVRKYVPPDALLPLFRAVATYRALSVPHAHELVLRDLGGGVGRSDRNTRLRIATLIQRGFLASTNLPARPPLRLVYLTAPAFTRFPELLTITTENARKEPPFDVAVHAWTRAALAVGAKQAGFTVGRDLNALSALRRFLVDQQDARVQAATGKQRDGLTFVAQALRNLPVLKPWTMGVCQSCSLELAIGEKPPRQCPECGGQFRPVVVAQPHECSVCGLRSERGGAHVVAGVQCPGLLRSIDYLPFDLAWRRAPRGGYEVQVLLADNPYRSVVAQLEELPIRIIDQPVVPIVLRPSDDGSLYDRETATYAVRGSRLRAFERALSRFTKDTAFPYWMTTSVVTDAEYPAAHYRVVTRREEQ